MKKTRIRSARNMSFLLKVREVGQVYLGALGVPCLLISAHA